MKANVLCLGFQKTTRNQWLSCIYNTVPEQFNLDIRVCAGGLFPEPGRRVVFNAGLHKGCFYKVSIPTLQVQSGASQSQPVSMFSYLKNLPLTIQTRVLSSVE